MPREHSWSQMFIPQCGPGLRKCSETAAISVAWLSVESKLWLSSGKKLPRALHQARTSTAPRQHLLQSENRDLGHPAQPWWQLQRSLGRAGAISSQEERQRGAGGIWDSRVVGV